MKNAFALHTIHTSVNGEVVVYDALQVISLPAEEYADLLELGAVREPTEAEAALFKVIGDAKAAPKAAPAPKAKPAADDLLAN